MSMNIFEEVAKARNPEIDPWLANALESQQMANMYDLYLEQVAMEFNNLLLKREVSNSTPIRTSRYGRKVFLGGLPIGITS
uniref:Uncharacterized protein n=1 Tax=Acrobeloides nanus TaxID=290746 RepID=A0A914D2R6_9BILA